MIQAADPQATGEYHVTVLRWLSYRFRAFTGPVGSRSQTS